MKSKKNQDRKPPKCYVTITDPMAREKPISKHVTVNYATREELINLLKTENRRRVAEAYSADDAEAVPA